MATIGKLSVMLVASTKAFVGGMGKAAKSVASFGSNVAGVATSAVGALGVAVAGLGASIVAASKKGMDWGSDLAKTARLLGATTEGVSTLQFAVKSLGGDSGAVVTGLATLSEKLFEASTQGGVAADTFTRLGVDFKKLTNVPVDEAFIAVARSIAAISDPAARAAAAFQVFGKDAAALLPLLAQGEKGIVKAAEAAKALGISIDGVKANAIEDSTIAVGQLLDIFKGLAIQIAANVAPWIIAVTEKIKSFGLAGIDVGSAVTNAFRFVAKGVAYLIDVVKALGIGVKFVQLGILGMAFAVVKGVEKAAALAAKLPGRGKKWLAGVAEDAKVFGDALKSEIGASVKDINKDLKSAWPHEQVDKFFDSIINGASTAAEKMKLMKNANGSVPFIGKGAKLFEEGLNVFNKVKTPLQTFQDEMKKLNSLLSIGAVSWDTYARASAEAVANLEKAHQLTEIKLPNAATRGSAEAQSAINRAERENDLRLRESPQERIRRILEETKDIERRKLELQQRIAEALAGKVEEVRI